MEGASGGRRAWGDREIAGIPNSRTQITQITTGFSPIDPAMMMTQPLAESDFVCFENTTAEASRT